MYWTSTAATHICNEYDGFQFYGQHYNWERASARAHLTMKITLLRNCYILCTISFYFNFSSMITPATQAKYLQKNKYSYCYFFLFHFEFHQISLTFETGIIMLWIRPLFLCVILFVQVLFMCNSFSFIKFVCNTQSARLYFIWFLKF